MRLKIMTIDIPHGKGVSMDSLKFHPGPPSPTLLHPASSSSSYPLDIPYGPASSPSSEAGQRDGGGKGRGGGGEGRMRMRIKKNQKLLECER
jgi:hypothetical protein